MAHDKRKRTIPHELTTDDVTVLTSICAHMNCGCSSFCRNFIFDRNLRLRNRLWLHLTRSHDRQMNHSSAELNEILDNGLQKMLFVLLRLAVSLISRVNIEPVIKW